MPLGNRSSRKKPAAGSSKKVPWAAPTNLEMLKRVLKGKAAHPNDQRMNDRDAAERRMRK